jgi:nitrate reductase beta subunit
VGRLRYLGVLLYDADRVLEAASVPDETDLYEAQLGVFLDPEDPAVRHAAEQAGVAHDWIEAARRSPVHALIARHRVALPLHPEYRTMPMVWYVPPLSPVVEALVETGFDGEDAGRLFAAIDALRIPVDYLAELFTAGDPGPVRAALERLAAMRAHMREVNLGRTPDGSAAAAAGMTARQVEELYRLLAIAKYEERYVIPTAATADAQRLEESALPEGCSLDVEGGPGMGGGAPSGSGPLGEASGGPPPVAVENFHALRDRQRADDTADVTRGRVNLLNWDGRGRPAGLFPGAAHRDSGADATTGTGTDTVEADRAHSTGDGGENGGGHPGKDTGTGTGGGST